MSNYRLITLLSFGHLVTDINQGALPAILPFLIAEFQLTYSAAATIVFAANSASAIVQPLFGYLADRLNRPWLIPIAILVAGLGLGLVGFTQSYVLILILVTASGIGIAAFHPQAARLVNFAGARKKGTSMSFFGLGGTLGFAIGPILATSAIISIGLKGTSILILPALLASIIIFSQLSRFKQLEKDTINTKGQGPETIKKDRWLPFSLLSLVIIGRSITFYGMNTFIPLYWTGFFNESIAKGGVALSVIAISGVFGNIFGGWISDKIGFKKVIIIGFLCLTIFLPLFIMIKDSMTALFFLFPIGFVLAATYSPTIVLGQEYLPNRVGFSAGVTLGLSVVFGGIAAPFIGIIADNRGIWSGIAVVACFPAFTFLLSLFLPVPDGRQSQEKEL